jgi:uncharacterized protein (TIGR03083 family)
MTTDDTTTETAGLSAALQTQRAVLTASAERLAALVAPLSAEELRRQAYPTEWSVADVLSHLGSGAVILRRRLDGDVDAQAVWNEWNAKEPEAQAGDARAADRALLDRLAALTPDEEAQIRLAMGPVELDLTTFLGLRVNEHALHTWDVAVTIDATATVPEAAAALMVDTLPMMTRFVGKPTGADRDITIRTDSPTGHFIVALRPDGVTLSPGDPVERPDLELTADALVRLVFGRLDPDHTPTMKGSPSDLEELRRAFPGF